MTSSSPSSAWVDAARRLEALPRCEADRIALEYTDLSDPAGRLRRTSFEVRLVDASFGAGAACFDLSLASARGSIAVPLADVEWVYRTPEGWVVRLAGAIDAANALTYVALGREAFAGVTARGALRLKELGPLKDAAMTAWKRLGVEGVPSLHVPVSAANDNVAARDFLEWTEFDDAVKMLSFDDPTLKACCEAFVEKFSYADECWFRTRVRLRAAGSGRADFVHLQFTQSYWGGRKGLKVIEEARAAYVALLRHIDSLLG